MNWSTRLRRWVRIRTPPVREASMKPTAATVLPAPVACSNQKRRSAPGSSGDPRPILVLFVGQLLPVLGLLPGSSPRARLRVVGGEDTSSSGSGSIVVVGVGVVRVASLVGSDPSAPFRSESPPLRCLTPRSVHPRRGSSSTSRAASARRRSRADSPFCSSSATRAARVPERASTWCSESSAPSSRFGVLLGEQALQPEHQRVLAPPLRRRGLGAGVELGQGGVAARRRAVPGASTSISSPSSSTGSRVNSRTRFEIGVGKRRPSRARGDIGGFFHGIRRAVGLRAADPSRGRGAQ